MKLQFRTDKHNLFIKNTIAEQEKELGQPTDAGKMRTLYLDDEPLCQVRIKSINIKHEIWPGGAVKIGDSIGRYARVEYVPNKYTHTIPVEIELTVEE